MKFFHVKYNYIVIEGNIGAGKTSLATRLSLDFQARLILEQFEDNSFLPRFYQDPDRFAFPLELSFLADRYQQLTDHFTRSDLFQPVTISDYFIYKSLIFASKNLESTEFGLYQRMFQIVQSVVPAPDLIVYLFLDPENLKENIQKRGRAYEQNISLEYLETIQNGYLDFFRHHPDITVLMVESGRIDFVNRESDYQWIAQLIRKEYPAGITRILSP
ncbi:MAG: deoxynucleoside kinase [Bacteroidales bacterium]|nr:deoxynucleoside kinase [Bacteroidales bacterium]